MKYDTQWNQYRLRIIQTLTPEDKAVVKLLVQRAYTEYTGLPPRVSGGDIASVTT
jgi:hypothetical protein